MVLNQQSLSKNGINFISAKGTNNGVSAKIRHNSRAKKYKAGAITVALKGSVMSAFLQPQDFYIAHQTAVLYPKISMSDNVRLYYCMCLRLNKYRFNYGRQADRTLRDLELPSPGEIPVWAQDFNIHKFDTAKDSQVKEKTPEINLLNWKWFELQSIFNVKKGKRLTKANMKVGETPFIGSIDSNNGYRQFISTKPIHEGNTITVNYNGSVAEAFYQPRSFWASDDVNVLYPKFKMNIYSGLFIATVIKKEKYRFNYGRKWHVERMNISKIKLPINDKNELDLEYMEAFIKSLPYSSQL